MTLAPRPDAVCRPARRPRHAGRTARLVLALLCLALAGAATGADRQMSWASLTVGQQQALAPLKRDWASIDSSRRQKWLEVAARFPALPADEQARIQERMADWAALPPAERARARLQFQETRRLGPEERQARWEAYQALSEEERARLAQAARPGARRAGLAASGAGSTATAAEASTAKSNVVSVTATPRPRPVSPTIVQARPGVSTTSMAAPATPPVHHQAGLPKIVATPGFVDPATLLPKVGPQGAAARTAASDTPPRHP